jgi:transposase
MSKKCRSVVAKWNTIKRLAIDEHRNNTVGWFVMITNDVKDPVKAMEIYRRKDAVEKGFDDLKNDLDCKRL